MRHHVASLLRATSKKLRRLRRIMKKFEDDSLGVSRSTTTSLLGAALAGFLSLSAAGCSTDDSGDNSTDGTGGGGGEGGAEAEPDEREQTDVDGDGVDAPEDCDDQNNRVYPGAAEIAADGLDSDCDGEDLPAANLVWSAGADDNQIDALKVLDTDKDGAVSIAEFAEACKKSAKLVGDANPGLVQLHASCSATNSCRGMVYQSWNEIYEHTCRGVNLCAGWSCVETADDEQRSGEESFEAGSCGHCHSAHDADDEIVPGVFNVQIPLGEDEVEFVSEFWTSRTDEHLRSVIGFGVAGVTEEGQAYSNMPGAHRALSLSEIDSLIKYLRTLKLEGHYFSVPAEPSPIE
jgi:Putative metal-binding motif